jgi:hypothetical protein
MSGFAEHGAAGTVLGEMRRVASDSRQLARAAGPSIAVGGSVFAFCPRESGSEELSGFFGGPPHLASNSAMRGLQRLRLPTRPS